MLENEIQNVKNYWNNKHENYNRNEIKYDSWLEDFENIIFNCDTPILDLGCGSGNDTLYLVNKGKDVIPCDISENAIKNIKKNFPEVSEAKCFNMLDGLPFDNKKFELIIADLSLHYFRKKDTEYIISELKRILKSKGYLIVRLNSINDTNYGAGQGNEIEHHLYETKDGRLKRFFDKEEIRQYFKDFDIKYLKEEVMTRCNLEKTLFRVCMQKD